jgi:predicted permease
MGALIEQLCVLYIFIIVGFYLGKKRPDASGSSGIVSYVLVNVFFPAKIFLNFSTSFTVDYVKNNYISVFIGIGLLLLMLALGVGVAKLLGRTPYEKKVYVYSTAISNYAYLGYVLVGEALGDAAMNNLMTFCIPISIFCNTVGIAMLMDKKINLKNLFQPVTVAMFVGIAWGLLGLPMPQMLNTVLKSAGACMGPVSMVLVGLVLAGFTWKQLLPSWQAWGFCLVRLIIVPAMVYGVCMLIGQFIPLPDAVYPSAVIMAAMPCGLNPVVYPKLIGQDCSLGAKLIPLTSILSMATIPLWLWIIM